MKTVQYGLQILSLTGLLTLSGISWAAEQTAPALPADQPGHHVVQFEDRRTPILLPAAARDLILAEMRAFLQSVQQITAALAEEDFKRAADAARKVGRAAQQGVPKALMQRLPEGFRKLGGKTHAAFDQFAMDAETMEDVSLSLKQLAGLMTNCTSCHAAYRLVAE